jgi:O-antigen/teichoic acid export membrane protein
MRRKRRSSKDTPIGIAPRRFKRFSTAIFERHVVDSVLSALKLSAPNFITSRKLWSDSFWTLFGNIVGIVVGLATIRIITRIVPAEDYGNASLILGVIGLLGNIFIVPLMSAHLRVYFDYLERGLERWFARKFYYLMATVCGGALLTYIGIAAFNYARGARLYWSLLWPAFVVIISTFYLSLNTNYLEAHRFFRRLAAVNTLSRVLYLMAVVLLLRMSVAATAALVWAQAVPGFLLPLIFPAQTHETARVAPPAHGETLTRLKNAFVSFGWALPLVSIGQWVLSTSDRYVINHFLTPREVGIYVVNYGLWSIPYTVLNGWLETLTKTRIYRRVAQADWPEVERIWVMRLLVGTSLSLIGTVCLWLIGERIAALLLGSEYQMNRNLMMSIALAHCCYVAGNSALPLFVASKRAHISLLATILAATSNIGINLLIVPIYGTLGAGISILLGYAIWSIVLIAGGRRILRKLTREDLSPKR